MYKPHNAITLWDRFVAIATYYTFGMAGLIWLIASILIFKKHVNDFCSYHIYQSIFISILLAVISIALNFIFPICSKIPFIGDFIGMIYYYVFHIPMFFTFTLFNFVVFVIISYLALGALLGKKTYFPFISDVISGNFR